MYVRSSSPTPACISPLVTLLTPTHKNNPLVNVPYISTERGRGKLKTYVSGWDGGFPGMKVVVVPMTAPEVGPKEYAGPQVSATAIDTRPAKAQKEVKLFQNIVLMSRAKI